jgi:hypothetical protein
LEVEAFSRDVVVGESRAENVGGIDGFEVGAAGQESTDTADGAFLVVRLAGTTGTSGTPYEIDPHLPAGGISYSVTVIPLREKPG